MSLSNEAQQRLDTLLRRIRAEKKSYAPGTETTEHLSDVLELPEMKSFSSRDEAGSQLASIFKSYDIRGVVISYLDSKTGGTIQANLTPALAERIGRALAGVVFHDLPGSVKGLAPGDCFVIGMDNGNTSPVILEGLASGLTRGGVNVFLLGEGCTGEIYSTIQRLKAQGGIMITRSHVEKEYNGMKIVLGKEALHSKFIDQIRDAVLLGEAVRVEPPASGIENNDRLTRSIYKSSLIEEFKPLLAEGRAPVALNFGGGTARLYEDTFREILGERLTHTFRSDNDPEALAGLPDPTQPRYLSDQIAWSQAHPHVTLFSFDLDADRVSAMVGGNLFLGDMMAFPLAAHKLQVDVPRLSARLAELGKTFDRSEVERIAGTVLADPRCTKQLSQLVQRLGGQAVQHRIGHSHIKATMNRLMGTLAEVTGYSDPAALVAQTGYVMWQAEYSLHFFGTDDHGVPSDDALRFTLKFISVMDHFEKVWSEPNLTIDRFIGRLEEQGMFGSFFQAPEIRTVYDNEDKARVVADVEKAFQKLSADNDWQLAGMDTLGDGFRVDMPDGFILFRYSNTSPKLTMRIEAGNRERWRHYFELLFSHYNRLRKPEYTLDMNENSFLKDRFGIENPDGI